MSKAWLEMCGREVFLGYSTEDGSISYLRAGAIHAIKDVVGEDSCYAEYGDINTTYFGFRAAEIFRAIKWYYAELAAGRGPGTHVIERMRQPDPAQFQHRELSIGTGGLGTRLKNLAGPDVEVTGSNITSGRPISEVLKEIGYEEGKAGSDDDGD